MQEVQKHGVDDVLCDEYSVYVFIALGIPWQAGIY